MKLSELLAFAVKHKALELRLSAGMPPLLKVEGDPEPRRLNLPAMSQKDIDALLAPMLDAQAQEALRFSGKCEVPYEVKGLGQFAARISIGEAVFVLVLAERAEGAKSGFFRKLLGG